MISAHSRRNQVLGAGEFIGRGDSVADLLERAINAKSLGEEFTLASCRTAASPTVRIKSNRKPSPEFEEAFNAAKSKVGEPKASVPV